MRIIRVFPRRTRATPDDALAFTTPPPPANELPDADEVHVSVAFTYDMAHAEQLATAWEVTGLPVRMGGPAFNEPGGDFVPGLYLRPGYVVTSRGCTNRCWFCSVPQREGYVVRELPVTEGWNLLDDNLLACSEQHIRAVFEMLSAQKQPPVFTGGLEAKLLQPWHVQLLKKARARRLYFAYDTPNDYEPLVEAGKLLREGGFSRASHAARCYVLVGYEGDSMAAAEARLRKSWTAGFLPYAMLYRDQAGNVDQAWRSFQREWVRPQIIMSKLQGAT